MKTRNIFVVLAAIFGLAISTNATVNVVDNQVLNECYGNTLTMHDAEGNPIDITTSGIYYDTVTPVVLPDTDVVKMTITFHPSYSYLSETMTITKGDHAYWRGNDLSSYSVGTYPDALSVSYTSTGGCDSTYHLTLNVNAPAAPSATCTSYNITENVVLCKGNYVTFYGHRLENLHDTWTETIKTAQGCDSVVTKTVTQVLEPDSTFKIVEIPAGDSYSWLGGTYTEAGTYYHHFTNHRGCDSVAVLQLSINTTPGFECTTYNVDAGVRYLCPGETFTWNNQTISAAGDDYVANLKSKQGCDSIVTLTVLDGWDVNNEISVSIYAGENYSWHGHDYGVAGDYEYISSEPNSECGCGYKETLHLTVNPRPCPGVTFETSASLCPGEVLNWNGKHITKTGDYVADLKSTQGCDSTVTLHVVAYSADTTRTLQTIEKGQSYYWHGTPYTLEGKYRFDYTNEHGCPSIDSLILTVNCPVYHSYLTLNSCDGESVWYNGVEYATSTAATDIVLKAKNGCDSTVTLTVNIYPKQLISSAVTIADRDLNTIIDGQPVSNLPFEWRGKQVTGAGVYRDTVADGNGCNIYYEHTVTVTKTTIVKEKATTCDNIPYNWARNSEDYTESGVYYYVDGNTLYELTLTVYPTYEQTVTFSVCPGEKLNYRDTEYAAGSYDINLTAVGGCDSTIHLIVSELPSYHFPTDTVWLKKDSTYNWAGHNMVITKPGIYRTEPTATACDSIYTLVVRTINESVKNHTICENALPYFWRYKAGTDYPEPLNTAGVYQIAERNGQDSAIYTLNLTVNPVPDTVPITVKGCDFAEYLNNIYLESQTIITTIPTTLGCDSVIKANIIVSQTIKKNIYDTISESYWDTNEFYVFGDNKIKHPHKPYVELTQHQKTVLCDCDSTVILHLTICPILKWVNKKDTICESELPYFLTDSTKNPLTGEYHGLWLSEACTLKDVDKSRTFQLTVHPMASYTSEHTYYLCMGDSIERSEIDGKQRWIYTGGDYIDTIPSQRNHALCDSFIIYHVYDRPVEFDTLKRYVLPNELPFPFHGKNYSQRGFYNDTTLYNDYADPNIHGCPKKISTLELHINSETDTTLCRGSEIYLLGQTISAPGVYKDTVLVSSNLVGIEMDSIVTYNVRFVEPFLRRDTVNIPAGTSYNWVGHTDEYDNPFDHLTAEGTYRDVKVSSEYCDSIWELDLYTRPTYYLPLDTTICVTDLPFVWGQQGEEHYREIFQLPKENKTKQYYDSLVTKTYGFDSIYHLTLTVIDTIHVHEYRAGCEGDSTLFDGKWIKTPGEYVKSMGATEKYCDSIVHMHYVLNTKYYYQESVDISDKNVPYVWSNHYEPGSSTNLLQYSATGIYYDSLKTTAGCDSIYELRLTVGQTYEIKDSVEVCELNMPYEWQVGGEKVLIYEAGTYSRNVQTAVMHYDSIRIMKVKVNPILRDTITETRCDGASFTYNNKVYTRTGEYRDTIAPAADDCGQITVLYLSFETVKRDTVYKTIPDVQTPYTHDVTRPKLTDLTTTGWYSDTILSKYGCDSIITSLYLTVGQTYYFDTEDVTVCESSLPYIWEGHSKVAPITKAGIYKEINKTVLGYDSIYTLDLKVLPTHRTVETYTFCQGDSIQLADGQWIKESVQNKQVIVGGQYGCDSVITYNIQMLRSYHITKYDTISDQQTYDFFGDTKTLSGKYVHEGTTKQGCDSVVTVYLFVAPTYHYEEEVTVCESSLPYIWEGHSSVAPINAAGDYYDVQRTTLGYDSIYHLNMSIRPTKRTTESYTFCQGDSIQLADGSFVKTTQQNLQVTVAGQYGCDSVITYNIQMLRSYHITKYDTISDQQTYEFFGDTYNTNGKYIHESKTKQGCDSIVTLYLFVAPTYHYEEEVTICESDLPYIWPGHAGQLPITKEGDYYDVQKTTYGYDSIYHLAFNIRPTKRTTINTTFCQGDSVQLADGSFVKTSVTNKDVVIAGQYGCDSIITYNITMLRSYHITKYDTISDQQLPYNFMGEEETNSGKYIHESKTAQGCDSIVTLYLFVAPTYHYEEEVTICESDLPYIWPGHAGQLPITKEGDYYDVQKTTYGYDSIYHLAFHIRPTKRTTINTTFCQGDSVQLADGSFVKTSVTNKDVVITGQYGCDSIITYNITMLRSYHITKYDTISDQQLPYNFMGEEETNSGKYIHESKTAQGCDSIVTLYLFVAPTYHYEEDVTICESDLPYTWMGHAGQLPITKEGDYYDVQKTTYGYDSIYHLAFHIRPTKRTTINTTFCQGDSVQLADGSFIKTSVTNKEVIIAGQYGCDSIITYNITMLRSYHTTKYDTISDQQLPYNYPFQGLDYKFYKSTDTTFYGKTVQGCDTTVNLRLIVGKTYDFGTEYDTICASSITAEEPYIWHGQRLMTTGDYYDAQKTVLGYDSIYHLNLFVRKTGKSFVNVNFCKGESVLLASGRVVNKPGTYMDTIANKYGCDSIITYNIQMFPSYSIVKKDTISEEQIPYKFTFDGTPYFFSRTIDTTFVGKTVQTNCDSIVRLQLIVGKVYRFETEYDSTCVNDLPYLWHNKEIRTPGIHEDAYKTIYGYDSIFTLNLKVLPVHTYEKGIRICDGDSIMIGGAWRKTGGNYKDTLTSLLTGCDSIITYHLTKIEPKRVERSLLLCHDDIYRDLNGNEYTVGGNYNDTLTSLIDGCDSIVTTHVTFKGVQLINYERTINENNYYVFDEDTIRMAGQYIHVAKDVQGCDSVIKTLNLTVLTAYSEVVPVTVCESELPFRWREYNILRDPGVYNDVVSRSKSLIGQDSTFYLHLTILPSWRSEREIVLCQGESYTMRNGQVVTESGVYNDTTISINNGCDSIISLYIQFTPLHYNDISKTITDKETYNFYGEELYREGTYTHVDKALNGCDSLITTLSLTILPTYDNHFNLTLCQSELPYVWEGHRITEVGEYDYSHNYLSVLNTDSTATWHITVLPSYQTTLRYTLKQGDDFRYNGKTYTTTGVYKDTLVALNGCDSVITLQLTYTPRYYFDDNITICYNERPLEYHGHTYYESGLYTVTFKDVNGNDSIYHLSLTVQDEIPVLTYQVTFCEGESYKLGERIITEPGTYYDTLRAHNGCDSIHKFVINRLPSYKMNINAAICQGETYDFYGRTLRVAGEYEHTFQTYQGCDSVYHLNLTVWPSYVFNEEVSICVTDLPYLRNGKWYEQGGVYDDTLYTVHGCDSIYRFTLNVANKCSDWGETYLCNGDSLIVDGHVIKQPGEYAFFRRDHEGLLDSLTRIGVLGAYHYEFFWDREICQGDTFFIGNKAYTHTGTYNQTITTVEGCDSTFHLNLTVNPSYRFFETAQIVDYNGPFKWRGGEYSETGRYDFRLGTDGYNCDSLFTLDLNVVRTTYHTEEENICEGETYKWRGRVLSQTGYYADTILDMKYERSEIYAMNLHVFTPTIITEATVQETCADELDFIINFDYSGPTPMTYSVYFDDKALAQGFHNIVGESFRSDIIIRMPEKLGNSYVRPDTYTMKMVLDNGVCDTSRSNIEMLVKYPSLVMEQSGNDLIALLSREYNGGYTFDNVEWLVNGMTVQNGPKTFLYNEFLSAGDEVKVLLTRKGEATAIPSCTYFVEKETSSTTNVDPILIYPNTTSRMAPHVTMRSPENGRYMLFAPTGTLIEEINFEQGDTQIELPAQTGVYFIQIDTEDGQKTTEKIIIF